MDNQTRDMDGLRSGGTARRGWYRAAARELARAVRAADPTSTRAASALAVALLEREADGVTAARMAAAVLDAVLIAPGDIPTIARGVLESAADELFDTDCTPPAVARRLQDVLRAVAAGVAPGPPSPGLDAVIPAYCADHLNRGSRLQDLARHLGYSASHCSTMVRRATGASFTDLRRRLMVERALGLLRDGSSVKAAALGAGFTDPAYFSRVFSRRYGVPPSRWREVDDDDVAETGSG